MMSSSRRKQMKPRSMKIPSPDEPRSVVIKADYFDGDHENDEDFAIDGEDAEHDDYDKGLKHTETSTSAASYNEAEDVPMSDGEQDDVGLLDMTGEDADTADPLGGLPYDNAAPSGTNGRSIANNNGTSKPSSGGADSSPFECHICHRKFKHRRSKSRHVMYHTGQKRHFCRYCNASFYRSDHLKAHTRTHTMPGILDGTCGNGEMQTHRQQPSQATASSRNHPPTPAKRVTIAVGNNGNKRPSFDLNASSTMREDAVIEPPLKIAHKDDSLLACNDTGRRSISSADQTNSNFAMEANYDGRHSMSTPLFYGDAGNNNQHNSDESSPLITPAASSNANGNRLISNDSLQAETTSTPGHRRCPFCQTSFSTADQLRRHLREENCTLHPDANNSNNNNNNNHSHHHPQQNEPIQHQSSRTKSEQFAIPEPISRSSALLTCPLCPSGQQQQQFSQATMLVHLTCEHRFTQEQLLTAVQQAGAISNTRNAETPGSTNNGPTVACKLQAESSLLSQGLPSFVCPSCDLSTANLAKFHQHMFSAHLKFFYRCSLCNFSAPESEALAKHFLGSHCRVIVNGPSSPLSSTSSQQNVTAPSLSSSGAIDYSSQSNKPLQLSRQNGANNSSIPSPAHKATEVFMNERALGKHGESEHRTVSQHNSSLPVAPSSNFLQTLLQNSTSKTHPPTPYHSDSVIQCLACSRTFRGRLAMKQHLIQFHHFDHVTKSFLFAEEPFYVCDICPDVFRTKNVLTEHNLIVHPQISVPPATISSASSSSSTSSIRRPAPDSAAVAFPCSFCADTFAVAIDLEKHVVEKHPEDLLKSTSNVISAVVHQQGVPATAKVTNNNALRKQVPIGKTTVSSNTAGKQSTSIRCQQCSSVFESQYALEMHAFEEHLMNAVRANGATSAPVPESGEPVDARPTSAAALASDVMMAVDEQVPSPAISAVPKRFQCNVCDKIFADLPLLAHHRIREHGAGCCGESASNSTALMRCPLCRVTLASASDYLKHADSHHKGSTNLNRTYYACCLCNEYLRDMADLTNHAVRVHFPDALTCVVCDSPLPDVTAARSIRLPGTNDLVYCCADCYDVDADLRRCNLCNAVFDTVDNLKFHNAKYHASTNNGKTNNGLLSRNGNNRSGSSTNSSGNRLAKQVVGNVSSKISPASPGLSTNKQNNVNNDGFVLPMPVNLQCSLCDTLCQTEDALTLHLIEHSFPDGNYQCPICVDQEDQEDHSYFDSAVSLDDHVRSVHGSNAAIGSSTCLCTECSRAFLWPAELNHHVNLHDLERDEHASQPLPGAPQTKAVAAALQNTVANLSPCQSFTCNVCQRAFPTVRSLANHQRQCLSKNRTDTCNNGDQDAGDQVGDDGAPILAEPSEFLRCFICKNKFANAQSLQKHARTIHGLESAEFWCPLCDSKLVNYKQLLHHLSSEHDINIAQSVCELCGDAFTMLKNLKRHLKRVHKVIWQAPGSSSTASTVATCASQHMAAMNGVTLTGADSSSVGTSEESPEDTAITVVDD